MISKTGRQDGLKGDWSGKTLVIKQGTNEGGLYNADMSQHLYLFIFKRFWWKFDKIVGIIANSS